MGIKLDSVTNTYTVSYAKRHPITRVPVNLRRKGFKSMAEARRALNQIIVDVEDKVRATQTPKWEALIEESMASLADQGLSARTLEGYYLCAKAHTLPDWSGKFVDDFTAQEIRQLVDLKVGMKSVASQRNLVKILRNVFQCAIERGYIKANPVPRIRFRIAEKVKKVLTEEQAKALLTKAKVLDSEWYPHWALAIYTGMRSGELHALTWDQVSFECAHIVVDRAWNSKDGLKSTKSGHDRIVPINETLMVLLKELKLAKEGGPYVLPRQRKWDKGEQARELQKFLILNGLPPVRFHDLRATWATLLLSKGVEPVRVMKMGGWRDMKTMMIYTRMAGIDTKGATDCLNLHDPTHTSGNVVKIAAL